MVLLLVKAFGPDDSLTTWVCNSNLHLTYMIQLTHCLIIGKTKHVRAIDPTDTKKLDTLNNLTACNLRDQPLVALVSLDNESGNQHQIPTIVPDLTNSPEKSLRGLTSNSKLFSYCRRSLGFFIFKQGLVQKRHFHS